jgi:hypothetical protein
MTDVAKFYPTGHEDEERERELHEYQRLREWSYGNKGAIALAKRADASLADFDEQLLAVAKVVSEKDGLPEHEAALAILAGSRYLAKARLGAGRGSRAPASAIVTLTRAWRAASAAAPGDALRCAERVVALYVEPRE